MIERKLSVDISFLLLRYHITPGKRNNSVMCKMPHPSRKTLSACRPTTKKPGALIPLYYCHFAKAFLQATEMEGPALLEPWMDLIPETNSKTRQVTVGRSLVVLLC